MRIILIQITIQTITDKNAIENNTSSFQELYELTQRKFLSKLIRITNSKSINIPFPRLFCIDLIDAQKIKDVENVDTDITKNDTEDLIVHDYIPCIIPMCEAEEFN